MSKEKLIFALVILLVLTVLFIVWILPVFSTTLGQAGTAIGWVVLIAIYMFIAWLTIKRL